MVGGKKKITRRENVTNMGKKKEPEQLGLTSNRGYTVTGLNTKIFRAKQ